jgi:hypothetical protein
VGECLPRSVQARPILKCRRIFLRRLADGLFVAGRSTLCEGPSWSASLPRLVIVSNRVSVPDAAGKGTAGGVAVALREAFQNYQGLWFGWSGKVAAYPSSQPRMVDKGHVQYALVDLTSLDRREYYNGFANRALWLMMQLPSGPVRFLTDRLCRLLAS